jgi:hypothetical protein
MGITNDVTTIQKCVSATTVTLCNEGCQWRHGTDQSTIDNSTVPTGPQTEEPHRPLFSTDFCHPATIEASTDAASWSVCVDKTAATDCSIQAGCNWSDGKEAIPDHDFCAPMDLTLDLPLIQRCVSTDTDAQCNNGCAWRHGRNATNATIPVQP